jgi:hypothetical protein
MSTEKFRGWYSNKSAASYNIQKFGYLYIGIPRPLSRHADINILFLGLAGARCFHLWGSIPLPLPLSPHQSIFYTSEHPQLALLASKTIREICPFRRNWDPSGRKRLGCKADFAALLGHIQ